MNIMDYVDEGVQVPDSLKLSNWENTHLQLAEPVFVRLYGNPNRIEMCTSQIMLAKFLSTDGGIICSNPFQPVEPAEPAEPAEQQESGDEQTSAV